jgi:hypothetical protein
MENIPSLAQNIGLALITLLVPIALALLSDKKNIEFEALDKNVILDYIVRSKDILLFLGFIFIPPFFWNHSDLTWRYIEIAIWSFGVAFMVNVLIRSYNWIKGDKFPQRYNYLGDVEEFKDQEESWKSIWETSEIDSYNEGKLIDIFSAKVDSQVQKLDDRDKAARLLEVFSFNVDKRQYYTLLAGDTVLTQVLNWYKKARTDEEAMLDNNGERNIAKWSKSEYLSRTLRSLITKLVSISVTKSNAFYNFISTFKKHVEDNKSDTSLRGGLYIADLLSIFYPIIFNDAPDSDQSFEIFESDLPSEWLITESNLDNNENSVYASITWNEFFRWARTRILQGKEDWDKHLDIVMEGIFPDVDPMTFAPILMCVFNYYPDIQPLIEAKWNFGLIGRSVTLESIDTKNDNEEFNRKQEVYQNNSIRLGLRLFGNIFTENKISELLSQLNNLEDKYEKESIEINKVEKMTAILEKMKSNLAETTES